MAKRLGRVEERMSVVKEQSSDAHLALCVHMNFMCVYLRARLSLGSEEEHIRGKSPSAESW